MGSAIANSLGESAGKRAAGARIAGGQYWLKRLLGRGACSEVWLAWDRARERDIALKFFPDTLAQNAVFRAKLQEGACRCEQLDHPAIARVYALVQDAEHLGVALERVDGWSLATLQVDRVQRRYTVEEILPLIRQLCGALDYAHRQFGLAHGAVKPSNLLLNAREQLKVTDFLLAGLADQALAQDPKSRQGSAAYLSPQQLAGADPRVADDVYSLGATVYELLTGTPPFFQGDISSQVREAAPPLMTGRLVQLGLEGTFPMAWEEAIAACLAKDPARRPLTAAAVLEWLERPELIAEPGKPAGTTDARSQPAANKTAPAEAPEQAKADPDRPHAQAADPAAEFRTETEGAGAAGSRRGSGLLVYAAMFLLGMAVVFGVFLAFRKAPARGDGSAAPPASEPAGKSGASD